MIGDNHTRQEQDWTPVKLEKQRGKQEPLKIGADHGSLARLSDGLAMADMA